MMTEPKALKEIHDIRLKIYEETKHMTTEERTENTQKIAREVMEKYGLTHLRHESLAKK